MCVPPRATHAPLVNEASESIIQEIVRLIKTAVDDKSEAQKKSARARLSGLSVNCLGCHSTKGTGDGASVRSFSGAAM